MGTVNRNIFLIGLNVNKTVLDITLLHDFSTENEVYIYIYIYIFQFATSAVLSLRRRILPKNIT